VVDFLALHVDVLEQVVFGEVLEVLALVDLELSAFGETVLVNHEFEVGVQDIADCVAVLVAQQLVHVVVLEGSDLDQEAKGVAADHPVPLEQHPRVLEGHDLVRLAVDQQQERLYPPDVLKNAEAVVGKGGVGGEGGGEERVDGGEGRLQDDPFEEVLGSHSHGWVASQAETP